MNQLDKSLSEHWDTIQSNLFPEMESVMGPLSCRIEKLLAILEFIQLENHIFKFYQNKGRPAYCRRSIARAFIAKSLHNISTTKELIEWLLVDRQLRLVCGFEHKEDVPSASVFSRVFQDFAETGLAEKLHDDLVQAYATDPKVPEKKKIAQEVSRDSTAILAREKPLKKEAKKKEKKKRGRPKKGEEAPPKEPSRLEKQKDMTFEEMIKDLPTACDKSGKRNSKGNTEYWIGYKLHLDVSEGGIPLSAILTSASVHDSQVALPLMEMTSKKIPYLYELMDAAYDSKIIKERSEYFGHKALIDNNFRRDKQAAEEKKEEEKALKTLGLSTPEKERYKGRSTVERVNARLKDEFGGRTLRVKGAVKAKAHLMFGVLALTADQILRFLC